MAVGWVQALLPASAVLGAVSLSASFSIAEWGKGVGTPVPRTVSLYQARQWLRELGVEMCPASATC